MNEKNSLLPNMSHPVGLVMNLGIQNQPRNYGLKESWTRLFFIFCHIVSTTSSVPSNLKNHQLYGKYLAKYEEKPCSTYLKPENRVSGNRIHHYLMELKTDQLELMTLPSKSRLIKGPNAFGTSWAFIVLNCFATPT